MKKILYWAAAALFAVSLVSCDLNRDPEDKAKKEPFKTIAQARQSRDGLYSLLRESEQLAFHVYDEVQSDMYTTTKNDGNQYYPFVAWQLGSMETHGHADEDQVYGIAGYYFEYSRLIQQANSYIEDMEKALANNTDMSIFISSEEVERAKRYLAEVRVVQALANWRLMDRFAYKYDAASNQSPQNLGIVLIKEFNPAYIGPRATQKECYDHILSALEAAITVLPEKNPDGITYAGRDYAHALRARVHLSMGNYADALADAKQIVEKYPLINANNAEDFAKIYRSDANNPEIVFRAFASPTTGAVGATSLNGASVVNKKIKYAPFIVPLQWVVDLYEDADYRKSVYIDKTVSNGSEKGYLVNKFLEDPAYRETADIPILKIGVRMFSIAEAYLMVAECAHMTGDDATAIAYLKKLSAARGGNIDTGDVMKAIQEERTRELIGEGARLRDMIRWNLPNIDKTEIQPALTGYAREIVLEQPVPAGHYAFTWEFPNRDRQVNPHLIKNW